MREDITCVFEGVAGIGGIYISNLKAAQNPILLKKFSIKAMITAVRGEAVKHAKEDVTDHLWVPVYDDPQQDMSKYFQQTFNFIDSVRKKTNVLVHCYAGISRSATIVIAYLLRKYNYSLENVITMVKRRRSKINPNKGFIEQLKQQAMKIGLKTCQKGEDVEKILFSKTLRLQLSPEKKRAVSAYTKKQNQINFIKKSQSKSIYKSSQNLKKSQIKCSQQEKSEQNKNIKDEKTKNIKDEKTKNIKDEKIYSLTPQQFYSSSTTFSDAVIYHESSKKQKTSSPKFIRHIPPQPLQQSKFMNPKMAQKIERFKEKVLMIEEQKKMRKTISDLNAFENDRSQKKNKKIFDMDPFNFQSVNLSRKLQIKQQNQIPEKSSFTGESIMKKAYKYEHMYPKTARPEFASNQ